MKKVSIKNNQKKKKKKGFTLVELIIVIAIIALLAAMAIPKLSAVKMDAKVSNDVAAAKNIQTVTAMLLANGTFTTTANASTDVSGSPDIKSRLSGKYAEQGKAEAIPSKPFTVTIDGKENIEVFVDTFKLYPEDDAVKKTYLAEALK